MAKFDFRNGYGDQLTEFTEYYKGREKLNLGSNSDIREGYINIDMLDFENLDVRGDVRDLSYIPENSAEEVLAYDLLEHFPFAETRNVLTEWISVLSPGGKIIIRTPDLDRIAHAIWLGELPLFELQRLIYGGQDYEWNFHQAGFTASILEGLVLGCGCSEVIQLVQEEDSLNSTIVARK